MKRYEDSIELKRELRNKIGDKIDKSMDFQDFLKFQGAEKIIECKNKNKNLL